MTADEYTASDVQTAIERFEERGLTPGMTTTSGTKVHAVDFDSDSPLVRSVDEPDKLLCGRTAECTEVEAVPTKPARWCQTCLDKVLVPNPFLSGGEGR